MSLKVEDLEDQSKYREVIQIPYSDLVPFVFDYLKRKSGLMYLYWGFCMLFLCIALFVRINIEGHFIFRRIFLHTILGLVVFPVVLIPVHELLHIIPYYLTGARKIRIGMDLKQYMFYVTAHRHVAGKRQFSLVAWFPFLFVSTGLIIMILFLPGLWKWSLSLLLFAHCTMCAGDIALLNFYEVNRGKRIYTWDDADKKTAYFYEEI